MKVFVTNSFKRIAKKLRSKEIIALEEVIQKLRADPLLGELKTGDLTGIRVYKFRLLQQLILLAYCYDEQQKQWMLLSVAAHENFYKNLKIQLN